MNTLSDFSPEALLGAIDFDTFALKGSDVTVRRLSDLAGSFADKAAYDAALSRANPVLYQVSAYDKPTGPGQLQYGLGVLFPGKVGDEYYLTKGHFHQNREASEVYIGLRGKGAMLLEEAETGLSRLVPLEGGTIVYVPGHTAHRTVNTGTEPLLYLGVYPWDAGHDYGAIAERNFLKVVREGADGPELIDR